MTILSSNTENIGVIIRAVAQRIRSIFKEMKDKPVSWVVGTIYEIYRIGHNRINISQQNKKDKTTSCEWWMCENI